MMDMDRALKQAKEEQRAYMMAAFFLKALWYILGLSWISYSLLPSITTWLQIIFK